MRSIVIIIIFILPLEVLCQPGWNWPANKLEASQKVSLYTEFLKQAENTTTAQDIRCQSYQDAILSLRWLLINCPDLNFSIYANGTKVYRGLSECTKDAGMQKSYQDSALLMYDLRIKYFKDEANVLNRKGMDAQRWHTENIDELYEMYNKIFQLNGSKTYHNHFLPYMDILCKKIKSNQFSEEDVLGKYDTLMQYIDDNISADRDKISYWQTAKENVDKMLYSCVTIDCKRVITTMGPKLEQNPTDIILAKRIFTWMKTGKCTEDVLFLKTAKIIYNAEPSSDMAAIIGVYSVAHKDLNTSIEYFNKAIQGCTEPLKQADYYLRIAECYKYQGNKINSRNMARKTLSLNPDLKDAYNLIAILYMTSSDECKTDNSVTDKGCFWVAYDQFEKAGNYTEMNNIKKYFPTKEEIFFTESVIGKKAGDKYLVGCWINENTTIRSKD